MVGKHSLQRQLVGTVCRQRKTIDFKDFAYRIKTTTADLLSLLINPIVLVPVNHLTFSHQFV